MSEEADLRSHWEFGQALLRAINGLLDAIVSINQWGSSDGAIPEPVPISDETRRARFNRICAAALELDQLLPIEAEPLRRWMLEPPARVEKLFEAVSTLHDKTVYFITELGRERALSRKFWEQGIAEFSASRDELLNGIGYLELDPALSTQLYLEMRERLKQRVADCAGSEPPKGTAANYGNQSADPPAKPSRSANLVMVYEEGTNKPFQLDTEAGPKWAGEPYGSDFDGIEGYFTWTHEEMLYRRKGWILVEQRYHCEVDIPSDPTFRWLTDEQAAEWLLRKGHRVPEDIACHVAGRSLDDAEPSPRDYDAMRKGNLAKLEIG